MSNKPSADEIRDAASLLEKFATVLASKGHGETKEAVPPPDGWRDRA